MTLIAIKKHMITVKSASMDSLCRLFQTDPDTLRCLLSHWINKGKIRRCARVLCASKCAGCPVTTGERYEWTESAADKKRDSTTIMMSSC